MEAIMLNLECQTVYDIIRRIAEVDDVYKVVEADEIIAKLPQGLSLSKIQLSAIIRELKDREYISVKYFTPDEYCLLVIKRIDERAKQQGQLVVDAEEDKPKERALYGEKKEKKATSVVSKGALFFAAFMGSFIGSTIVAVIAVIVTKFAI